MHSLSKIVTLNDQAVAREAQKAHKVAAVVIAELERQLRVQTEQLDQLLHRHDRHDQDYDGFTEVISQ